MRKIGGKSKRLDRTETTMGTEDAGVGKMSFTENSPSTDVWRWAGHSCGTTSEHCCSCRSVSEVPPHLCTNNCCSNGEEKMGAFCNLLPVSRRILSLILTLLLALTVTTQVNLCSAQKLNYKNYNNPTSSIVIPHIKYGQGLNKWSFLSLDRSNHGLYSDLLCPNPLTASPGTFNRGSGGGNSGTGSRGWLQQQQQHTPNRFSGQSTQPLPNEIWAVKTDEEVSHLPCSVRQYAVPSPPFNSQSSGSNLIMMNTGGGNPGPTRHNNGHFIENRILLINVSLVPFNFHGAIPCSKYIKLMFDEEEGTNLRCRDVPFDNSHDDNYHINWPKGHAQRKEHFSLLENLERFLKNEKLFRRQFYFQVYFTSFNGRSKRCTVQQYELDLSYPSGNARFCNLTQITGGYDELCGEFHCDDLIFPLYTDPPAHESHEKGRHGGRSRGHGGGGSMEDDDDDYIYEGEDFIDDDLESIPRNHSPNPANNDGEGSSLGQTHNTDGFSWSRMLRLDMRLLIFITIVPLVLFGILVFGLELIIYFTCCRKKHDEDGEGGERAQQLLQNSLNVWENVPSRDAQRTVSFSPMTTSIYGERKNMQLMDAASLESHPETPKILKSALKKSGEHSSPTTAAHHYFEYDHDMPPSYIETTSR